MTKAPKSFDIIKFLIYLALGCGIGFGTNSFHQWLKQYSASVDNIKKMATDLPIEKPKILLNKELIAKLKNMNIGDDKKQNALTNLLNNNNPTPYDKDVVTNYLKTFKIKSGEKETDLFSQADIDLISSLGIY